MARIGISWQNACYERLGDSYGNMHHSSSPWITFQRPQKHRMWLCQAKNVPPAKGRGKSSRKASAEGLKRIMRSREADTDGWTEVASVAEFQEGKNKAIIYKDKGFVIVKRGDVLSAIEANCTSCKFPVIEGKVTEEAGVIDISCPLCHTRFSLADGSVVEYCPKDGPLQWVIGALKEKAKPEPAKVFPARVSNAGRVYVRFAKVTVL